jgi:hypothetical protein
MANSKPSLVKQFEQVMSPSDASEEFRDLTAEEIEVIRRLRAQSRTQVTNAPAPAGYQTISIPDKLAASIFGQMSHKQMETRWIKEQADTRVAKAAGMSAEITAMFDERQPIFGVPTIKQMQLSIKKFDGTETYKGLGANFTEWGTKFTRQIAIAQVNSGFWWQPEDKIEYISSHLDGKSLRYFESQSPIWMKEWSFLEFVMIKMETTYRARLSVEQAVAIF